MGFSLFDSETTSRPLLVGGRIDPLGTPPGTDRYLIADKAFATATAYPLARKKAWSFSASPIDTTLCADRPKSTSAAFRPLALLTPGGSTMTAPLLNTICSSSPCSRMASRTSFSFGSQVAMIDRPTDRGTTRILCNASTSGCKGSGASGASLFAAGSKSKAPFSATTRSKRSSRGKHAHEVWEFSASDQHKLPAGPKDRHSS